MDWLRRFGPTLALAVAAVVALTAAVVLTFAGAEAGDGHCGTLWSREDGSPACRDELDGRADLRVAAGATAGVAALGAAGL